MAKKPLARKVRIIYDSRVNSDPMALLEAVEKVYRPREIEIRDEPSPDPAALAEEQVEAKVQEYVANLLEELDRRAAIQGGPRASAVIAGNSAEPPGVLQIVGRLRRVKSDFLAAGARLRARLKQIPADFLSSIQDHSS